jgi:hypothetical protein
MGFLAPKTPSISPIAALPPAAAPMVETNSEAESAKRDLAERMKRAEMSRQKSVLKMPALVNPVSATNRTMLSSVLG